jgi:hypothetical protein
MENFDKLDEYLNIKNKMLYTFCFYKITVGEIIVYLANLLDKIGSMKDAYKRKLANERVYGLKCTIETMEPSTFVNSVFLVDDKNKSTGFTLNKTHIQTLSDFKIPCSQYWYDDTFNIVHLKKLVSTDELVNVIYVDGSSGKVIQIDSVKNKHNDMTSNLDNLVSSNKSELIFGTPVTIQNLQKKFPDKQYFSGKLSNEQVWNQIVTNTNLKTQEKFNTEVLVQMSQADKIDLFVFGRKNVREEILLYGVKKIFITPDIYNKYKTNLPTEYFNFEVNIVDKVTTGDYGDILIKNFEGVVAIKYY